MWGERFRAVPPLRCSRHVAPEDAALRRECRAFTRLTLTFTGSGSMLTDARTIALNNANGAVQSLWHTTASSFTVNAVLEASDSAGGPWTPAASYFGTPSTHGKNTRSGIDTDRSHVDIGFYYLL